MKGVPTVPIGDIEVKRGAKLIVVRHHLRKLIGEKLVAQTNEVDGTRGYTVRAKGKNVAESEYHVSTLEFDPDIE
jgi:hypothetical protein